MTDERSRYLLNYSRLNWKGENFSGKTLSSINFSQATICHGDFSKAHLRYVDFTGADLTGTNFSRAILHNVDFGKAILHNVTFAEAELSDVDFSGALLQDTDLMQATFVRNVHLDNPRQWTKPTLSTDGKLLAWVEEREQHIWLWEIFVSEQGQVLAHAETTIRFLSFHPLKHLLMVIYNDSSVAFWDADARRLLHHLKLRSQPDWDTTRDVAFSPDGQWLVIPSQKNEKGFCLFVWDIARMRIAWEIPAEYHGNVAFSPDSTLLAVRQKTSVDIWKLAEGTLHAQFPLEGVRELSFQASGNALFVLADKLYQIEVKTGRLLDPRPEEHPGHTSSVTNAAFSPDGRLLATCDTTTVQVWQVPDGKHVHTFSGYRAQFSPDGLWLMICALTTQRSAHSPHAHEVQYWDIHNWSLSKAFSTAHPVDHTLVSPDGRLLVCYYGAEEVQKTTIIFGAEDDIYDEDTIYFGEITIFEIASGTLLWPEIAQQMRAVPFYGHWRTPAIWQATFSSDSRWLTLLCREGDHGRDVSWIWDLANEPPTGERTEQAENYPWWRQPQPSELARSPDGRWRVQAEGHHVQIWDQEQQHPVAETGEPPNPPTIHPAWHNQRVALGLVDAQETWNDLLESEPPDSTELEQVLIEHKIAFEDRLEAEQARKALPRGSRQDESWHSVKELTVRLGKQRVAAVHPDGTLSVFHAGTGQYQQMYHDPLDTDETPG